jgi:hypothetical protein
MKRILRKATYVLDRTRRRLSSARPGSVLILVVVLVVLLALMGTALLSTTRSDRYTATQNAANTQVDIIIEGVKQIAQGVIGGDMFGGPTGSSSFRPGYDIHTIGTADSTYEPWDAPLFIDPSAPPIGYSTELAADLVKANDQWLSPRAPKISIDSMLYWTSIGMLPSVTKFDTPFVCNDNSVFDPALKNTYSFHITRSDAERMAPAWVQPVGSSETYPAWYITNNGVQCFVLAADADGDGIADAGLMKLPFGEIDGVTYYWGVRIVDHNSAINVNTAFSQQQDFGFDHATQNTYFNTALSPFGATVDPSAENGLGIYRSHVGLRETLSENGMNDEIDAINFFRFGNLDFADWATGLPEPVDEPAPPTPPGIRADYPLFQAQGEALEYQLARRTANPGLRRVPSSTGTAPYRAFSIADTVSLAYHNVLINPEMAPSQLETVLMNASSTELDPVYERAGNHYRSTSPVRGRTAYTPNQVGAWFSDNYNYSTTKTDNSGSLLLNGTAFLFSAAGGTNLGTASITRTYPASIRSILTSYSATSNQAPTRAIAAAPITGMKVYPTTGGNPKTNVNTASFEELWRAYWCVMAEPANATTGTPFVAPPKSPVDPFEGEGFLPPPPFTSTGSNPQMMFRSSIRDMSATASYFENKVQLQLRAAIAAQQTIQLRNPTNTLPVELPAVPIAGPTPATARVKIYGTRPQPFISEIYAWNNPTGTDPASGTQNTAPYVGVELYNPFPVRVSLEDLIIYAVERKNGVYPFPASSYVKVGVFKTGDYLDPYTYGLVENFDAAGGDPDVHFRPASTGIIGSSTIKSFYISDLENVKDKEMIIVRNQPAVLLSGPTDIANSHINDEPIDSFDFTGFTVGPAPERWSYTRGAEGPDGAPMAPWLCVYPGRYNAPQGNIAYRQQGTQHLDNSNGWDVTTEPLDPPLVPAAEAVAPTLGQPNISTTVPAYLPIPLGGDQFGANAGYVGPNGNTTKAPFGKFARDGDILQVPFIGSYIVYTTNSAGNIDFIYEMNSVSMDAAFAEDSDPNDDYPGSSPPPGATDTGGVREQVGRFCPILMKTRGIDDFDGIPQSSTQFGEKRYAWASDLFDYLTVQSPSSDYLPDVPEPNAHSPKPTPIDNDGDGKAAEEDTLGSTPANIGVENSLSTQGRINLNTANWRVLAAIPWVPRVEYPTGSSTVVKPDVFAFNGVTFTTAQNGVPDDEDIAKAIVAWRDGDPTASAAATHQPHGPFRSIYDLYKVTDRDPATPKPIFEYIQNEMAKTTEPDDASGDFSPLGAGTDHSRYDFEEQYLLLTKVSNLITTHSDSFTVYIVVQGWQGVGGTTMPKLVVQRRAAFIQDRSTATKSDPNLPAAVNVPND